MSFFGRNRDRDEERAERAHDAIDDADAGMAIAQARSDEARSRALELADTEVGAEQVSLDAASARADEQVARAIGEADTEADRTIHRALDKAETKKAGAREKAAAGVSRAEQTAAERHVFELTRAAQLREHAGQDPALPADPTAHGTS